MSNAPIKITDRKKKWAQRQMAGSPQQVLEKRKKILVVTQDGKSSRFYFEAWQQRFAKGVVWLDVRSVVDTPMGIVSAIQKIRCNLEAQIAKQRKVESFEFDEVWVAFDKDSFADFDNAVYTLKAMAKDGYREAWSNECFELWYLLHDHMIPSHYPISRTTLFADCAKQFSVRERFGKDDYEDVKGAVGRAIHEEMAGAPIDVVLNAVRNAKALETATEAARGGPSAQPSLLNPLTKVHHLVEEFVSQSPTFVGR